MTTRTRKPRRAAKRTAPVPEPPDPIIVALHAKRLADALRRGVAVTARPNDALALSDLDSVAEAHARASVALRSRIGDEFIAALCERRADEHQRFPHTPECALDWDRPTALLIGSTNVDGVTYGVRSLFMPDWMALPYVRRYVRSTTLETSESG